MVKFMEALALILSCSTPKYIESAPLSIAACSEVKSPAGDINSILPVFVMLKSEIFCKDKDLTIITQFSDNEVGLGRFN